MKNKKLTGNTPIFSINDFERMVQLFPDEKTKVISEVWERVTNALDFEEVEDVPLPYDCDGNFTGNVTTIAEQIANSVINRTGRNLERSAIYRANVMKRWRKKK